METSAAAPAAGSRSARVIKWGENIILALALAVMTLLPLLESLLRLKPGWGIAGSTSVVQHLTLLVGMLGGVVAAREDRLLALSTVELLLKGRWRDLARSFAYGVGAAVAVFLAMGAWEFVRSSMPMGDSPAATIVYGVPEWLVQAILPAGFVVIALRILWNTAAQWGPRLAALGVTLVLVGAAGWLSLDPQAWFWPGLILLLCATVLGSPIFTTLGGLALLFFWSEGEPIASIAIDHYSLVTNPTLPAIPLFTLAGYFLAEGGASKRLIRVFNALAGGVRGGPAVVTVLVCAFFTSFTGASGVTILALGGLLMPILLAAGYTEKRSLGLLTSSGSLGLLFPPCLPLILYAIVSKTQIQDMFLGGVLPGVILVLLTMAWGVYAGPRVRDRRPPFCWREAGAALWDAKWELALPLVVLWGLFSGQMTPLEAAALTAFYAFIIETFIYRDISFFRDAARIAAECGLLVGGVLLILGVALGFTNYLVMAEVPAHAVDWATQNIHSPLLFLLGLNLFLLVVGCLMDIFSAIVVVVPLIVPLGAAFGIDPIHLGIIFLANLELGYLTPPVGMNLFLSSYRFDKPLPVVYRSILPLLVVQLIGVLLITYVPWFTTWLPGFFSTAGPMVP
ncbi:MAG: TRAP transporter large permease subunit [Acidobacteria bacterium]|nr:TRAP transporter large permease subunit [Acidobacteriota bacterium]